MFYAQSAAKGHEGERGGGGEYLRQVHLARVSLPGLEGSLGQSNRY